MKHIFTHVKLSVTQAIRQSIPRAALALTAFAFLAACEPNHSTTDEAQTHVATGNVKLERMAQIDTELRSAGVSIKHPGLSTFVISGKPESQLKTWRKIVNEYIEHAEAVLKIADRPDIAFGEKHKISDSLNGANRLLAMIDAEIGNSQNQAGNPTRNLDAKFWAEWGECRKWTDDPKSRQMYGIEFLYPENQLSVRNEDGEAYYARLGREKRRKLRMAAQRHLACIDIEEKYTLHFNPNQSQISRLRRQRNHILIILDKVSVSPTI